MLGFSLFYILLSRIQKRLLSFATVAQTQSHVVNLTSKAVYALLDILTDCKFTCILNNFTTVTVKCSHTSIAYFLL